MLILWSSQALAQKWGGDLNGGVWRMYSVSVNAGVMSYFGDLSIYDSDPLNKLRYESRPAFGVIATKEVLNAFGISGQVLYGQLEGGTERQDFSSRILEYNLHLRSDLVRLIFRSREHRLGFTPYAGIGQFIFRTRTTTFSDEQAQKKEVSSRVPEFVYFAGAGLSYRLPRNLALSADMGLRQCRNDKLDGLVKNDNFDYYTYLSAGLTYHIGSIARQPLKNKSRLAHSETFLPKKKRIRYY